ncbi:hypothetical protein A1QG_13225 [Vibrio breoganii ZF-29]|nr:hypothetical protein A1QG_13225 [Vibrio breoganii ZF-29]OEF85998.1 hypothetical protein B003_16685 [Vibrio breoganii 1C10]
MVTGAGGSIGSEICRQIIKQKTTTIVLFEVTELALYSIDKELQQYAIENNLSVRIVPLLGSVQRINRLHKTMRAFGIQTIYHAAVYKHVPMVEFNVVEGVRNNVFGNVLGSSGSVIPLFKKQIAAGGPITITTKDITRYFMTTPEAEPHGDVEITFTGLRPGEKLYEELLVGEEELSTEHSQIKKAQEVHLSYKEFMRCLDKMDIASHDYDHETMREQLLELPLQF